MLVSGVQHSGSTLYNLQSDPLDESGTYLTPHIHGYYNVTDYVPDYNWPCSFGFTLHPRDYF